MVRCSPFLWLGVGVQLLALLVLFGGFWYVGEEIPSTPVRIGGKGIPETPQSVYHLRILILVACGTFLAAVLSLLGLLEGPRSKRCILCGAPSIAVVALPVIAFVVAYIYAALRNAL